MSVKVMSLIWDCQGLKPMDKFVLLAYGDHADHNGNNVYPGIDLVSQKVGMSRRQVQRITHRLVVEEYMIFNFGGNGRGHPNNFSINLEKLKGDICVTLYEAPQENEERVTSTTERVTSMTLKGDIAMSPQPSLTTINHQSEKLLEYKERLARSVAIGMTRSSPDTGNYPEHLRPLVAAFCEKFNFKPPAPARRKGTSEYKQWIIDAEDFLAACDEVDPVSVLTRIRAEFENEMASHQGIAPFRVLSIRSLVKSARRAAGELRNEQGEAASHRELPVTLYV